MKLPSNKFVTGLFIFQLTGPKSCTQLLHGVTSSGVYTINPDEGKTMSVLCDMTTDCGGWTIFLETFGRFY